jgi:hypothetical protein
MIELAFFRFTTDSSVTVIRTAKRAGFCLAIGLTVLSGVPVGGPALASTKDLTCNKTTCSWPEPLYGNGSDQKFDVTCESGSVESGSG